MTKARSKCPKCSWTGTWEQFSKHYAREHFTPKKVKKAATRKRWPLPPFARKRKKKR